MNDDTSRRVDAEALRVRDEMVTELERILARRNTDDARTITLLAQLHAGDRSGKEFVREEVATALHWSFDSTRERMHEAVVLTTRFAASLAVMARGELGYAHTHALTDLIHGVPDDAATRIEARVLPLAPQQTVAEFRRAVRRAIAELDPRGDAERHEAARERRRIETWPARDGMAWLSAHLPAEDVQTLQAAVQAIAEGAASDDRRTADQRRADALVALAGGYLSGEAGDASALPPPGSWQGRKPSVEVVVALSTLLGCDDQPAQLTGHGAIPADVARRIAADPSGTWRRLVTDPCGRLLDHGTTRHRPPADLRDFVIARDRTCRMPGCNRPARRCDQDHCRARADGGTTCDHNIHCLCPRHHALKHEAGWHVTRDEDATTWVTPTGRRHTKNRESLPVDTTSGPPAVSRPSADVPKDADLPPF